MIKEKTILYLCNRKKCNSCTYQKCKHTQDINFAKNIVKVGEAYVEEEMTNASTLQGD